MIPFLIITVTFILTEFSAWANHKYIMHGTMWYFHADHHKKDHKSVFERNDIFFLIYGQLYVPHAGKSLTLFIAVIIPFDTVMICAVVGG